MATSKIANSSDYKVRVQTITDTDSTGSDHKNALVVPDSIPGYTPIGVVGWTELTMGTVYYYGLCITNNKIQYAWQTRNASVVKNHSFNVYVLYKKN